MVLEEDVGHPNGWSHGCAFHMLTQSAHAALVAARGAGGDRRVVSIDVAVAVGHRKAALASADSPAVGAEWALGEADAAGESERAVQARQAAGRVGDRACCADVERGVVRARDA
jgi:hypothetical protein